MTDAADPLSDLVDELRLLRLEEASSDADRIAALTKIAAAQTPLVGQLRVRAAFVALLASAGTSAQLRAEIARCTAEICKDEEQRKQFTEPEVLRQLLGALDIGAPATDVPSVEYVIQVCRALCNIVYQSDEARQLLQQFGGDATLVRLLDVQRPAFGADCSEAQFRQFANVRSGVLSNFLVGGGAFARRVMELGIMAKIESQLVALPMADGDNDDMVTNLLTLLTIVTENVPDVQFEAELTRRVVRVLEHSTNASTVEMCLDLLHYQAENDEVKLLLAEAGYCETILKLLDTYKSETSSELKALRKLACENIVLILTGDDAMHLLYEKGLIGSIEPWLDAGDLDLMTTGVLALGNFARTDSHCIYMVQSGVVHKLLAILARHNGPDDDMPLQHALLSTLRNLVIPKANKAAIVEAGLVQTILPMLHIHQAPVVFKLLGTLRMTVDGQERLALELLRNETLLVQLVHWSRSSEFASVTGESLRLMAWLIKHAYFRSRHAPKGQLAGDASAPGSPAVTRAELDDGSLQTFVRTDGAVECMAGMLTSQHLVMQNEALIALSILSTVIGSRAIEAVSGAEAIVQLDEVLERSELGPRMAEFIGNSADTMTKEIVENLHTLIGLLRRSERLSAHLDKHNIGELLKTIPILTEYCTL